MRSQLVSIPNALKPSVSQKERDLEGASSEEELENDFEDTPRIGGTVPSKFMEDPAADEPGHVQQHGASLATIRLHRRMHLAEKLKKVFDIEDIHEVLTGMRSLVE